MTDKISGPINILRLEGKIGNINKVIHLIMDYHISLYDQTICDDMRSRTLRQWLVDEFDRQESPLDFMMEIYPSTAVKEKMGVTLKYIWEMQEFFKQEFIVEKKGTIVRGSESFPNIRFHYLDVRDKFYFDIHNNVLSDLDYMTNKCVKWVANYPSLDDLEPVIPMFVDSTRNYLIRVGAIIQNSAGNKKTPKHQPIVHTPNRNTAIYDLVTNSPSEIEKQANHLAYKMRRGYKNEKLGQTINKYFVGRLNSIHKESHGILNEIEKHIKKMISEAKSVTGGKKYREYNFKFAVDLSRGIELVSKLMMLITDLYDKIELFGVFLVDWYTMRRLLDKNYVQRAIVYAGATHGSHVAHLLIHYFGFKLTHTSRSIGTVDKINKEALKTNPNEGDIEPLVFPPSMQQCSSIEGFPAGFM